MHVIVDYGLGNLNSLTRACEQIGYDVIVSGRHEDIEKADSIILPGVGAFGDAMKALKEQKLEALLIQRAKEGVPFLGICLGMQLLFESSEEDGFHQGLGLLKGHVKRIPTIVKVPHMGWNGLDIVREEKVVADIQADEYVYYVHSYYADCPKELIVGSSEYGVTVPGIVQQGNVYGMQFHPEKSSDVGLRLLKAYKEAVVYDSISSN
ncbi:MAG: imidazole glycerol phosphate synthase subunit HisH [Bacillaceae bacterium]